MRYLPLIWSGIWRKPGRTILIFLQVSVAFALFGMLQGLKTGVEHLIAEARADLLVVHSRVGFFAASLPLGMLEQIKSLPGVKMVDPVELFGGTYQKPTQRVGIVAVRPDEDWTSAFTFLIAPEYLADSFMTYLAVLGLLENNRSYLNQNPKCERCELGKLSKSPCMNAGGDEGGLLVVGSHSVLAG